MAKTKEQKELEAKAKADAKAKKEAEKAQANQPELIDHVLTEEDMENNPELASQGLEVGMTVQIPKVDDSTPADADKETAKGTKGKYSVFTKVIQDENGIDVGGDLVQEFDTMEEAEKLVNDSKEATGLDRWEVR